MHHQFIDYLSGGDSPIHHLDPRVKALATIAFVCTAVLVKTSEPVRFLVLAVWLLAVTLLSRLPILSVVKRALVVLPFVLAMTLFVPFMTAGEKLVVFDLFGHELAVTREGLTLLGGVAIKALLAAWSMMLLVSTTPFQSLLKGLRGLGVPAIITTLLAFLYRYLFVIVDQAMHMRRARLARSCGRSGTWAIRSSAALIGVLFMRSFERSERIYQAMAARGFDGQVRTLVPLRLRPVDVICLLAVMALLMGLLLAPLPGVT